MEYSHLPRECESSDCGQLQAAAAKQREIDLKLAMYRGAVAHKQPSDQLADCG